MLTHLPPEEQNITKVIEACRLLIKRMSNPDLQPLEREAGYLLAQALRLQVEAMGLLNNPDVQDFLHAHEAQRRPLNVRRYPQDFQDDDFFA